jgi:hypothetical protein
MRAGCDDSGGEADSAPSSPRPLLEIFTPPFERDRAGMRLLVSLVHQGEHAWPISKRERPGPPTMR